MGVDTGTSEKPQFFTTILPSGMDVVHLQNHVVVHEVGKSALVGDNATHLGVAVHGQ